MNLSEVVLLLTTLMICMERIGKVGWNGLLQSTSDGWIDLTDSRGRRTEQDEPYKKPETCRSQLHCCIEDYFTILHGNAPTCSNMLQPSLLNLTGSSTLWQ